MQKIFYTRFREPYSSVFKLYSGVLELDFPKLEFHAIFIFFIFLSLIGHNSILIKSSFEIGARPYIVWKKGYYANFFLKKGVKCQNLRDISFANQLQRLVIAKKL